MPKLMQSEPTPMRDKSKDLRDEKGRRLYPFPVKRLRREGHDLLEAGEHPPNTVPIFETDQAGRDAALKNPPDHCD